MLWDISQPVTERASHFPGDQPFTCGWTMSRERDGGTLDVGWAKTSPHVGTHVDAPFHYDPNGARVGGLALDAFVGPCVVIDAVDAKELHAGLLRDVDITAHPRVLFRTQQRTDPDRFLRDFPVLTSDAIDAMARARVRLVGIDAPSYDPVDSKELRIHKLLGRAGIANVENLRLDDVTAGTYEFLGAPVKWTGLDAAPLRALLRR